MKVRHTLLSELARRRTFARAQKQAEDAMLGLRNEFLARLGGRAPAELIEAVTRLPSDRRWFTEAERLLGISLVNDIVGEMVNSAEEQ